MKRAIVAFFCTVFAVPTIIFAQGVSDFGIGEQSLSVILNPAYPAPGETVTASIDDYSLGAAFSTISWSVNGKIEPTLSNTRSFTFPAPTLGETATIKATLNLPGGTTLEASGSVTPVYTDIIIEPQTYTPQAYAGRALPTVGSLVRASALVQTGAGQVSPANYSYVWKLNGTTLGGGSKAGAFQTSYIVPYGNTHTLIVEVFDQRGKLITRRGTSVRVGEVDLALYEVSPLYGLGNTALGGKTPFIGNTITVRAMPYNLDLRSSAANTFFEWRANNRVIQSETSDPYEITLERTGQGQSVVSFKLRHRDNLLQGGEVSTLLNF